MYNKKYMTLKWQNDLAYRSDFGEYSIWFKKTKKLSEKETCLRLDFGVILISDVWYSVLHCISMVNAWFKMSMYGSQNNDVTQIWTFFDFPFSTAIF